MPAVTLHGIVARYANYKDNDRILTLFTREQGLLSASARGCRRPNSPLLCCSELFAYGEYVFFESRGRYTLDSCDLRETFYPLREDVERFAAGMLMLCVTEHGGVSGERAEELFQLLYYALSYTAYGAARPADLALCFMVRALSLLGFTPMLTRCARCGTDLRSRRVLRFSPALGGAACENCAPNAASVSALSLEALRRMLLLEDADMKKVALPDAVRHELCRLLRDYGEYELECSLKPFEQLL